MSRTSMVLLLLAFFAGVGRAATEVEMEACHYTPEVKAELKLSASQDPKVEKVYNELAPILKQIQDAQRQRDEMRKAGAGPEEVQKQTEKLIALENQCREKGHELLKPILTQEQFDRLLEMEQLHRQRVRERQAAGQPAHR